MHSTLRTSRRPAVQDPRVWWVIAAVVVGSRLLVDEPAAGGLYLFVVLTAAVAGWVGALRAGPGAGVLRLIALGASLNAAGDIAFYVITWSDEQPAVSVADIGYLGSYVVLGLALWTMLPDRATGRAARIDGYVDGAVVFLVVALVMWVSVVAETLADESVPWVVRVVWSAYPVLDAVLIALVTAVTISRKALRATSVLLALGAATWLASDLVYALVAQASVVSAGLDAGWMVGSVLLAAATWARDPAAEPTDVRPIDRIRVGLVLVALLVAPSLEVASWLTGADHDPVPLLLATLLLLVLLYVRASRMLHDQEQLREVIRSRARFSAAVAANSSDAVLVLDADGLLTRDSAQLATLLGEPGPVPAGSDALALVSVDVDEARAVFGQALAAAGQVVTGELRGRVHDGRQTFLAVRLVDLREDPDVRGVVVNVHDATERREAQLELAHQALHDGLTGLANRALFDDHVQLALQRAGRTGVDPAVLYVDLDGFKAVNDTLGHPVGDRVLLEVAHRLTTAVRSGDTVARLGGDEFAVLVEPAHPGSDEPALVAARVLQVVGAPLVLDGRAVRITASVGMAHATGEATAASLLRDADIAMYRAKQDGGGRAVVFREHMHRAAVERRELREGLAEALDAGWFRLVHQPVVALDDERVVGFEALLRWDHPTLGSIGPDRFVPIAEETGLIEPIGLWVLQEAARTLARWQIRDPRRTPLSMAVNVSARQVSSGLLPGQVRDVLAETGIEPSSLVLELTETGLVEDPEGAAVCLQELRALGVRLAIDDFGTGYSSLSYLSRFQVDVLKIDRSFTSMITEGEQVPAILHAMVELGRSMQLEIVAEGVETPAQRDQLRAEGCDLAQGHLFSAPLEVAEAECLLAADTEARSLRTA